jgi:hypothetical protein
MPGSRDVLEYLSLAIVFARQLRVAYTATKIPPPRLTDLIYKHLPPTLHQHGALSRVIQDALNSTEKPQQSRSTDVLAALAKLTDILPPPSSSSSGSTNIVTPFLLHTIRSGLTTKANILIIHNLIGHVSLSSIPEDLPAKLVSDMYATDLGNYRGSILSDLLVRRMERQDANVSEKVELSVLLPLFAHNQPSSTMINTNRYLLPNLFKSRPSAVNTLLSLLEEDRTASEAESTFSAWMSVAALGVSSGHITIAQLPGDQLSQAITHSNPDVRLKAFTLIAGSRDMLSKETLSLVRDSLEWNAVLPNAGSVDHTKTCLSAEPGLRSRSELSSAFHAYLTKLKSAEDAARRKSSKASSSDHTEQVANHHHWFLSEYVDSGLNNARRPPVVRALLALNLLAVYVGIYPTSAQKAVYTEKRVSALFACQASEFTEARMRARGM